MNYFHFNVKNNLSKLYKFLNIFGNTYDIDEENKDELDVRCEKMEREYDYENELEDEFTTINQLLKIEEEIKMEEMNELLEKEVDEYLKMEEDAKIINQKGLEELIDYYDNLKNENDNF
jgi:hypothetical protein